MSVRVFKLILIDVIVVVTSLYIAFNLAYDFVFRTNTPYVYFFWLPWFLLPQIIVFYLKGLYVRIWRYTSIFDLYAIIVSISLAFLISVAGIIFSIGMMDAPKSILLIYVIINGTLTIGSRLSIRLFHSHFKKISY